MLSQQLSQNAEAQKPQNRQGSQLQQKQIKQRPQQSTPQQSQPNQRKKAGIPIQQPADDPSQNLNGSPNTNNQISSNISSQNAQSNLLTVDTQTQRGQVPQGQAQHDQQSMQSQSPHVLIQLSPVKTNRGLFQPVRQSKAQPIQSKQQPLQQEVIDLTEPTLQTESNMMTETEEEPVQENSLQSQSQGPRIPRHDRRRRQKQFQQLNENGEPQSISIELQRSSEMSQLQDLVKLTSNAAKRQVQEIQQERQERQARKESQGRQAKKNQIRSNSLLVKEGTQKPNQVSQISQGVALGRYPKCDINLDGDSFTQPQRLNNHTLQQDNRHETDARSNSSLSVSRSQKDTKASEGLNQLVLNSVQNLSKILQRSQNQEDTTDQAGQRKRKDIEALTTLSSRRKISNSKSQSLFLQSNSLLNSNRAKDSPSSNVEDTQNEQQKNEVLSSAIAKRFCENDPSMIKECDEEAHTPYMKGSNTSRSAVLSKKSSPNSHRNTPRTGSMTSMKLSARRGPGVSNISLSQAQVRPIQSSQGTSKPADKSGKQILNRSSKKQRKENHAAIRLQKQVRVFIARTRIFAQNQSELSAVGSLRAVSLYSSFLTTKSLCKWGETLLLNLRVQEGKHMSVCSEILYRILNPQKILVIFQFSKKDLQKSIQGHQKNIIFSHQNPTKNSTFSFSL